MMSRSGPLRSLLALWALLIACASSAPPAALLAGAGAAAATCAACRLPPPPPPSSDGGVATPAGAWTDRTRLALDLLQDNGNRAGALSFSITVVELWPVSDVIAKRDVLTSMREVRDTLLPELRSGLEAFVAGDAGGRCRVSAASRSVGIALRGIALTLARILHWDVETQVRFATSLLVSVQDELNPSCALDAGWSHLGADTRAALEARPSPLRAFPTIEEARHEAARSGR